MSQSLEMRSAVRTNGDALKRYIDFEQMQKAFISYKNKVHIFIIHYFYALTVSQYPYLIWFWFIVQVEIAVEALKDIAKEIHEIEVKNVKHKKNGYITSTVGR